MQFRNAVLGNCKALLALFIGFSVFMTAYLTTDHLSAEPSQPPVKGPNITQFQLDNGLDVLVIPDHRAPVVTHMVWYRVGAADEPPAKSGIAHFLEHLMFKGTKEIAPGMFSKIIAKNGGQDNAFTSQDVTAYHQRVAKDRLPLVMKMEADRMANLTLHEKDVLTEREVIKEERRSRVDNDPQSRLHEQMNAALYLNHPYGIPVIGWMGEISKLDRQDALDHYKKYYAPNNAILVVAGDVTADGVKKLALETYGKIPCGADIPKRVRPMEPPAQSPRRVELEDEHVAQIIWQRSYLVPSELTSENNEAASLDVLMAIVADGSVSRLYKQLVIEDKIASSAGGYYSDGGMEYGSMAIYAVPAKGTQIAQLEEKIEKILGQVKANSVTEAELKRAKASLIASDVYANDNQVTLARKYGYALTTGVSVETVKNWPERIKKVTAKDVQEVAKKYLQTIRSVTGVLKPKAKTP